MVLQPKKFNYVRYFFGHNIFTVLTKEMLVKLKNRHNSGSLAITAIVAGVTADNDWERMDGVNGGKREFISTCGND